MWIARCLQGAQVAGRLTCGGGCGDGQRCQRLGAPNSGAQHGRRLHAHHASQCCARSLHTTAAAMARPVMSCLQVVRHRGAIAHDMVTSSSGAAFSSGSEPACQRREAPGVCTPASQLPQKLHRAAGARVGLLPRHVLTWQSMWSRLACSTPRMRSTCSASSAACDRPGCVLSLPTRHSQHRWSRSTLVWIAAIKRSDRPCLQQEQRARGQYPRLQSSQRDPTRSLTGKTRARCCCACASGAADCPAVQRPAWLSGAISERLSMQDASECRACRSPERMVIIPTCKCCTGSDAVQSAYC